MNNFNGNVMETNFVAFLREIDKKIVFIQFLSVCNITNPVEAEVAQCF